MPKAHRNPRSAVAQTAICLALLSSTALCQPARTDLEGSYWQGAITTGGKHWTTGVRFVRDAGQTVALVDFPEIGTCEKRFSVVQDGRHIRFERLQPNAPSVVFDGNTAGNAITGQWSGFSHTASFALRRKKRLPDLFRTEEVTFSNGDITLSGSLVLPLGRGPFPAVVCIHGSGPTTRDMYLGKAAFFASHGIATLIYDKRSVGKSVGGDWQSATLYDLAEDALAGIRLLKGRADIRAGRVGAEGFSQGGWIAPLAARMSADVAFVIVGSPAGISPAEQSVYHVRNVMRQAGCTDQAIAKAASLREQLYKTAQTGDPPDEINAELKLAAAESWFPYSSLPAEAGPANPDYNHRFLFLDPVPIWQRLTIPVLAMWGGNDINLPVERSREIIRTALKTAGNRDVTLKIFANADHTLVLTRPKDAPWDFPRYAPGYFDLMASWIHQRFGSADKG
jgi:pimeloyl-ACP methyl ester carboxylesterase